MSVREEVYKGLIIYENINSEANTPYCSVFNPQNQRHTHIHTKGAAKRIVDCYRSNKRQRFGMVIRNKALQLEGFDVYY